MAQNIGVTSAEKTIQWRRKYRHYRTSRCRLYVCMISLMVFITLSVVCAAFLFRNSFHIHPKDYELNSGEMRVVQVSTLFCESIVLKPASFKRQLTVVSSPFIARRTAQQNSMYRDIILLRRDRTWYRSFYLLRDSVVSVHVASRHSINVYWLKGRRILDKWIDEMNEALKQSARQNTDTYTGTRMAETFTVNEDSNYYFGITSTAGNTKYSEIFANINVSRSVYDVKSYVTSCSASFGESCEVNLRFNSRDTAVIAVPKNVTRLLGNDVWISWYCGPRIWFYAAVFGGSFLLVLSLLTFVYCCIISRVKKKVHQWKPQVPERTESFNNGEVRLQSINVRESSLEDTCESVSELTPLTPATDACEENNKPDAVCASASNGWNTMDGGNNNMLNITSFTEADCVNCTSESAESEQWRRTPSPRWSTFLQDDDYEECETDFHESPINTLDSIQKETEDDSFESELMHRLQDLQTEYDGPAETDIDNFDSETDPFWSDRPKVLLRQKEKLKEQRWEPRLSVVTEI